MLAFTRVQSLLVRHACVHHGPAKSVKFSVLMARSVTNHSWKRFAYVYHVQIHNQVQIHNPTASTDWTRRVQSVLVRLACVHHGQIRYPVK